MSLRRIFYDDYTLYPSDAAFKDAYPFDPPSDMSTSATVVTWGATNGPGGVPGILGDPGFTGHGSGQYDKFPLDPQGRLFRLKLRTSCPSGYVGVFLRNSWAPSGTRNDDSAGSLVSVARTGTDLVVNVETTNAESNSSPLRTYTQTIVGALPDDTIKDIQIDGQPSVISGTAGSYAPDETGFITVSVDGVQVFSFTGAVWFRRTDINPTWNMVTVAPRNMVTNLDIYDEVADATIPTNDSNPCCADPGPSGPSGTPTSPGDTPPIDPTTSLPPWTPACAGGGTVPTAADIVDVEDWSQ